MESKWQIDINIMEEGDIYFFYKPKKGVKEVEGLQDISRFYIVMDPSDTHLLRFIVVGKKRLPKIIDGGEAAWAYIEKLGGRGYAIENKIIDSEPTILTRTARPVGEGIYAVLAHRQHTHLLYELELPRRLGDVQKSLEIQRQGSYLLLVKHAWDTQKHGVSHRGVEPNTIDVGKESQIQAVSGPHPNRKGRFVPVTPFDMRQEGAELLLLGANKDAGKLGVTPISEEEEIETADIFNKLQLSRARHSTKPLLKGSWE